MNTIDDVLSGRKKWCVICGDSLPIIQGIPDGVLGGVVTDPPYSSGGMFRGDRMAKTEDKYQTSGAQTIFTGFSGDNRDQRGFQYWVALWLSQCLRATEPGGLACLFTDWRQLPSTTDSLQSGGWVWRGIVPWDKVIARPRVNGFSSQAEYLVWGSSGPMKGHGDGDVYGRGVIRSTTLNQNHRDHSTQKPVEVMCEIVRMIPKDSVILDPFCGSGSTGAACVREGRRFIGIEMVPKFAALARRNIASEEIQVGRAR